MEKIRVIEFIRDLSDGGAENLVKEYVRLLNKAVFHPYIVTIRNYTNTAVYKQIHDLGIEVISIYEKWNPLIKLFNKIFGRKYIDYKMCKIVKEIRPNCIHAHLYTLYYLYRISNSLKNINLYYTCHSIPQRYFGSKYPNQTKAAKYLIRNNGMRMIALHEEMKKELNQMFGINNTVVINNGIDIEKYINISIEKKDIRKKIGIPEDAFVLGHIGRFIEIKNHDFIVDIAYKMRQYRDNFYLLLIGDGELLDHIEKRLKNEGLDGQYKILSNRSDVPLLLKAMDAFVFPSIAEGLGIALVEAQVSDLHCVVSDTIPIDAIISNKTKVLSLEDSLESWCNAILDINYKSDKRLSMSVDDYNMRKEIRKLEALYLNKA